MRERERERDFDERGFLDFMGFVDESDEDESEASLTLVIWRDLRISSIGTPDILEELGVPELGCSGTVVSWSGLELRLRCPPCITRALDSRLWLATLTLRSKMARAALTLTVWRARALRNPAGRPIQCGELWFRLERSLRLTAVVEPEGNRDVVVGFPTDDVLRGARDGQRYLQVLLLYTYDTC